MIWPFKRKRWIMTTDCMRIKTDTPLLEFDKDRFICARCNNKCFQFIVKDELWEEVSGKYKDDIICIDCFMVKLDRPLLSSDLVFIRANALCYDLIAPYVISDNLAKRLFNLFDKGDNK